MSATNSAMISPHAWGWPAVLHAGRQGCRDFPTRVGMARREPKLSPARSGFPHTRGDGPQGAMNYMIKREISPHAWGWPVGPYEVRQIYSDFPTRVGMARRDRKTTPGGFGFPHTRGDGPYREARLLVVARISPHAWGWPAEGVPEVWAADDFPTRVGMARLPNCLPIAPQRFPHTRGDGPPVDLLAHRVAGISPHAWGWPVADLCSDLCQLDFPTRVGMAR